MADSNSGVHQRRNGDDVSSQSPTVAGGYVKMKRNVGIISGTSFIVGSIIGSGIFISPSGVLSGTGSVGLSMIVWVGGGILSLFGALSYAELGTLIPKSGGEYPYFKKAMFPVIAYLFAWTKTIVIQPSSLAIICMTFSSYMTTFFEYCGSQPPPEKMIAVLAIVTICAINIYDTKMAASVQVIFTVVKLLAIGIIIVGGFVSMGRGNIEPLQTGFKGTTSSAADVAFAFYDAMWAYDGWNNLNYLTEELKNPSVNLPRANIIGVFLVTVVYVLTILSYLSVLGVDGLLATSAVAVDWGKGMLGSAWIIMPIAVLFSTFGAANGLCYASGRLVYAAAREEHLPEILSFINIKRLTPLPSLLLTGFIAILMVIPSDIASLIDFFSFASWLFYSLAAACVIILRFRMKDAHRPFKVFILIPIIFVLWALFLVIAPIVQDPTLELLWAFLFIVGGLLLYIPFVVFKLGNRLFGHVTTFLQLLFEVVPSPYEPDD